METTDNPHLTELKSLLLPTARYTGIINREEEVDDEADTNMIISSHISTQGTNWSKVIYNGIYDEDFQAAVDEILETRNASMLLQGNVMQKVNDYLELNLIHRQIHRQIQALQNKVVVIEQIIPNGKIRQVKKWRDYILKNVSVRKWRSAVQNQEVGLILYLRK